MGDIGPEQRRFEVLPADARVRPHRATVPEPEPIPVPGPEPTPDPGPTPVPEPVPQPPSTPAA